MTAESSSKGGSGAGMSARMDAMFAKDKLFAWLFVLALWIVTAFVLFGALPYSTGGVTVACWIAAIVLVIFNTASIAAMVRHYSNDKEHIYGTDIRHLDAGR